MASMEFAWAVVLTASIVGQNPVVEGDPKLLNWCADSIRANAARFETGGSYCGESGSVDRRTGAFRPRLKFKVQWKKALVFVESEYHSSGRRLEGVPGKDLVDAEPIPVLTRSLFDGNKYMAYVPGPFPGAGLLRICSTDQVHQVIMAPLLHDPRPVSVWTGTNPEGSRKWEEVALPTGLIKKATRFEYIREGSEILVKRHDSPDEPGAAAGLCTYKFSEVMSGHPLGIHYERNGVITQEKTFGWDMDGQGRYVLRMYRRDMKDDRAITEYRFTDFDPTVPDEALFTEARLKVRQGDQVHDLRDGSRYTYKGRVVDQDTLDALSDPARE
jgi:hypothetical protein